MYLELVQNPACMHVRLCLAPSYNGVVQSAMSAQTSVLRQFCLGNKNRLSKVYQSARDIIYLLLDHSAMQMWALIVMDLYTMERASKSFKNIVKTIEKNRKNRQQSHTNREK